MGPQRRSRKLGLALLLAVGLQHTALAETPAELEQAAYQAYLKHNYKQAIELYRQLIATDPSEAQHHYNLGVSLHQSEQLPEAIAAYEQALQLDPDYSEAATNLGALYLQQQNWSAAIATLEALTRRKSGDPALLLNLAMAYDRAGQREEAVVAYRRVLKLEPSQPQARARLAQLAPQSPGPEPGEQVVVKNPALQQRYQEARALVERKQWAEAVPLLEKLVGQSPNFVDAWFLLGKSQTQLGRYHQALQALVRTVTLQPDHIGAHHQMALAYEKLGQPAKGVEVLNNLLAIKPDYLPGIYDLARLHDTLQNPTRAIFLFEQLLKQDRYYGDALFRLGRIYHHNNQIEQAQSYYQQSIRANPSFAPAYYGLSQIALAAQHLDSAQKLLEKALQLAPQTAENHYLYATVLYHRKLSAAQVQPHLDRAIELRGNYTDALAMRGILHYENGRLPRPLRI